MGKLNTLIISDKYSYQMRLMIGTIYHKIIRFYKSYTYHVYCDIYYYSLVKA
jgi:hypothetical protein